MEGEPLLGAGGGGKTTLDIPVEQDVYSAILFLPAISRINDGIEYNKSARLALMLCIINAIMQIGVVQVINVYNQHSRREELQKLILQEDIMHVNKGDEVHEMFNAGMQSSRHHTNGIQKTFLPTNEREQYEEVSLIKPLCERMTDPKRAGTLTCLPPSTRFAGEWKNLDTDGDGTWSFQEAKKDKAGLGAKYGVSPQRIFSNAMEGFRMYAMDSLLTNHTFYLSQEVKNHNAMPKAYFNFWAGEAMLCSLFDSTSCEVAAQKGFFREALRPGRLSAQVKGISDLDSALHYCHRMLRKNGGCETIMPIDWKRNRDQRKDRCGKRELLDEGAKYVNPYDPDQVVHVLRRHYEHVDESEDSSSPLFTMFLILIIMLWLLSLLSEWRYLLKKAEFLLVFPGIPDHGSGGFVSHDSSPDDPEEISKTYHVTGLSRPHRIVLVTVWFLRLVVVFVLTQFGTTFLLVELNYLNLVMNSLALTFILTIDSMLFEVVESSTKEELSRCTTLWFGSRLPNSGCLGYCLKKECWGLFLVPIVSVVLVLCYTYMHKLPVLAALQCACNQEGPDCLDDMQLQVGWWNHYWTHTLPGAMHHIEAMRVAGV